MVSRNQVIDNISFRLSVLKEHVKQLNSLNIQSLNIHAENFYRDFLNLVFNYNLINMNTIQKNTPAIDLGEKEKRIAFQITSTCTKDVFAFNLRIQDDGSHSVNRMKVFMYDLALLFNEETRIRHPKLLIHDNIFDVDQDTFAACLNYLARQETYYNDFQYIFTLNRDRIENEEITKQLKLDINRHRIANLTKENKFLYKQDSYQEL